MTDPQPLVFAYFKLPPNHQSFLRIRETLWSVFVPQLENLSSALEAVQVIHPSPQATQILLEARKAAVNEVDKLWDFFHAAEGIASRYIQFLVYLSQNNLEEERYAYHIACLLARAGTSESEKAQQVMTKVREGIERAISRVISIMADNKDISSFITESSQVLAEIIIAADECYGLLGECREDFVKLQKEDFDEESFLREPSWEEFQLVQRKWREFSKTVGSLWVGWSKLKDGIRGAEEDFPRPENTPGEDSPNFRRNQTTTNDSLRDVRNPPTSTHNSNRPMGRNASALATPPHPSPSNKAKIPFWRKVLQRIKNCLSLKPFC